MFKALRVMGEGEFKEKKHHLHNLYINTLDPLGNQNIFSDWKGTFLSQTTEVVKNHILPNIMGCNSSLKCITWPLSRPCSRWFSISYYFIIHFITSLLKSENSRSAHTPTMEAPTSEVLFGSINMAFWEDVQAC